MRRDLMCRASIGVLAASIVCSSLLLADQAGGLAPQRAARIDHVLQRYTEENRIAGAVALVLRDGKPVYEKAFGWSDKEAGRTMTTDTIFRIASQTKAITSAAILSLVEEGKIGIKEPVGRFIASFNKTVVATPEGAEIKTTPARRAITIHDLLTHTAGISYGAERLYRLGLRSQRAWAGSRQRMVHRG